MADGPLANTQANARERSLEKAERTQMDADMDALLRQSWGRRFLSRLIYQVGELEALEFNEKIHDGACHAMHMARTDGIRWVGWFFAQEAQRVSAELWVLVLQERIGRAAEHVRKQQDARNPQSESEHE